MKGELGPLAQAVAKYQMERKIQKEMDKLKVMEEKFKKIQTETKDSMKDSTKDPTKDPTKDSIKDQDVNKNFYIFTF